ncbi:MAG TPA: DUF3089 domain-containing protein [Croceibacterium sp.]
MARKFLYFIAALIVLFLAALFALRLDDGSLAEIAFVPSNPFAEQASLADNAYADPAMWLSRPGLARASDPARWQPPGAPPTPADVPPFAVFFVHPTSYLERARWNAPLDDEQSRTRARTFLRGLASPFAPASAIWAPRYRQATFGAFLTDAPEGQQAIDAAYRDVEQAFDYFVGQVGADVPIVLAGHSQGAAHLVRLLRERIAGTPLQQRIALAYAIGWPISRAHDLPALGLPACEAPDQAGCLMSWSSFAEPAEPGEWLDQYRASRGFDGAVRGDDPVLCVNPVSGTLGGETPAAANLGTLVPNDDLSGGELVAGAVPAKCDARGLLLIGDPPELGPYVLPGNNYHVYDVPLFWANVRHDVLRRMQAWAR